MSSQGERVQGRCKATNLCAYCARIAAVENSELLWWDAMIGPAPEIWAVLTTRSTSSSPASFYLSRKKLRIALRNRWPDCEIAALVEFTTGYGPRSGGARRPHWNLLLKGIPLADLELVRDVIVSVWCSREDALPAGQHVGPIKEAGGLMRYIALHFQKESQAPPRGWTGHRFLKTRGYLWTSTPEARKLVRDALAYKRELWKARQAGADAWDGELQAQEAMKVRAETTWRLYRRRERMDDPCCEPASSATAATPNTGVTR